MPMPVMLNVTGGTKPAPAETAPISSGPHAASGSSGRTGKGTFATFAGMLVQVLNGQPAVEGTRLSNAAFLPGPWMHAGENPEASVLPEAVRTRLEWLALGEDLAKLLSQDQAALRQALEDQPQLHALLASVLAVIQAWSGEREGNAAPVPSSAVLAPWPPASWTAAAETRRLLAAWVQALAAAQGDGGTQPDAFAADLQKQLSSVLNLLAKPQESQAASPQTALLQQEGSLVPESPQGWLNAPKVKQSEKGDGFQPAGDRPIFAVNRQEQPVHPMVVNLLPDRLSDRFQPVQLPPESAGIPVTQAFAPAEEAVSLNSWNQPDPGAMLRTANEAAAVKEGQPAVHADRFAEEMARMVMKNFRIFSGGGISEAKMTLIPEHLGQVEVRLTMQNGQLTAQFVADTLAGKEALESQIVQLRASLQNQGVQVERLVVTYGQSSGLPHQFQEQRHPQNGRQPEGQKKNRLTALEDAVNEFDLALEHGVYGGRWSGSSFEVTA